MNVINPLEALERSIAKEIRDKLSLEPVLTPEDINLNQRKNEYLSVAWNRISNFEKIDEILYQANNVQFDISLEFKDLNLQNKAKTVIYLVLMLLTGYKKYKQFSALLPTNVGYSSYDAATGYIKYNASFITDFTWDSTKDFLIEELDPEIIYSSYNINLQLFNVSSLEPTDINSGVLVYDSENL